MGLTTLTDKANFKSIVIDTSFYNKLTEDERRFVDKLKNSMLEIFPIKDNVADELCCRLAENFAFISFNAIKEYSEILIDKKLLEYENRVKQLITESNNLSKPI